MAIPVSRAFLDTVSAYVLHKVRKELGSASEKNRIAVIDPAYVAYTFPGTLPKVTFEGEDTLSTKQYPVLGSYRPKPSDRVLMVPTGSTYVISGPITLQADDTIVDQVDTAATVTTTNTSYVSLTGGPSVSINLKAGQRARVVVSCQMFIADAGAMGGLMSFRSTGASGTVEAADADGYETGHVNEWTPAFRETIWGPATTAGVHTFEARYRVIGATTASYKNRRIIAEAL